MKRLILFFSFFLVLQLGFSQNMSWDEPILAGTSCKSVSIDSENNLYFVGEICTEGSQPSYFSDSLLPFYKQFFKYGYIAKTDTNLKIRWIKLLEFPISQPLLKIDNEDNIIFASRVGTGVKIDSLEIDIPSGESWALVIKFNSKGELLWYNKIKGSSYMFYPQDIKISIENNIFLACEGNASSTFFNNDGLDTIVESPYKHIFYAKYKPEGEFLWVKMLPQGYSNIGIEGMEVDSKENVYIAGWWSQGGSFDSESKLIPTLDMFFAKYNNQRELKWLKQYELTEKYIMQSANSLVLDEDLNSIYLTGNFADDAKFDGQLIHSNDRNIFLARYSLDGDLIWLKNMGSSSGVASFTEKGTKLYKDKDGFIYLGGTIGGNGIFDNDTISAYDDDTNSNSYFDSFVAKYAADGNLVWVTHAGHPNNEDEIYDFLCVDNELVTVGKTFNNAIFGDYILTDNNEGYGLGFVCKILDNQTDFYDISKSNILFNGDSVGYDSFDILSNRAWQILIDQPWIMADKTSGISNSIIDLTVDSNPFSYSREALIKIDFGDKLEKNISVIQYGSTVVGLEDMDNNLNDFYVYPNPASSLIRITNKNNVKDLSIKVVNDKGEILVDKIIINNQLDISGLKKGFYLLIIENENRKIVRKFVKN